ncbi:MAG: hypothetical protein AABW48_05580 [Nanoarchaeota archaeon]|mgnify:CR=1 FL=1
MFNKNKKAIMLKFLVSLILALIIFVPACYLGGRLFSSSTQAKDNYVDFVQELEKFSQTGEIGARESTLLIMDTATAIVYFEKGKTEVLIDVDARVPYTDFIIYLQKPSQCNDQQNCLCLFRKSEFDTSVGTPGYDAVRVIPKNVLCSNLNYNLEIESCSIGKAAAVHSYKCTGGFLIERHLADKSSWTVASYYEMPRRVLLYLVRLDGAVRIIGPQDELQNE